MMLRGLWKLTWIEIKVFLREPLGAFGTIAFPVLHFPGVGPGRQPQTPGAFACRQQFFARGLAGSRVRS